MNLFLTAFNVLPAFPMDGGRVLRAVLALRTDYSRATQTAAAVGQGFASLFALVGLFVNPFLLLIALFVYLGATQEAALAQMRNLTTRLPVSAAMITGFRALPEDASLEEALEILLRTAQHEFPIMDGWGRIAGIVTRDDLIAALRRGDPGPVALLAHPDCPVVSWRAPMQQAVALMQERQCPATLVVNDAGRLMGIVSAESVGEMLLLEGAIMGRADRRALRFPGESPARARTMTGGW